MEPSLQSLFRNLIPGGRAKFLSTRRNESETLLCKIGGELRKMMSWLKKK